MGKLIVIAWIVMLGMIAKVANVAETKMPIDVQFTETGNQYSHGDWCMDSRVF